MDEYDPCSKRAMQIVQWRLQDNLPQVALMFGLPVRTIVYLIAMRARLIHEEMPDERQVAA